MRKTAVITGATSGIGAAFAAKLAAAGCNLLLTGRRERKIRDLAIMLEKTHTIRAAVVLAELSDTAAVQQVIARIKQLERIDYLVNNAGFGLYGNIAETDPERQEQMANVHVLAVMRLVHAVLPQMIEQGAGAIINVASLAALCPVKSDVTYCGTKAFLKSYSEALYMNVKDHGIRVQALCPGFTHTDFHTRLNFSAAERKRLDSFHWMTADAVVDWSLKYLKKKKVLCIPGAFNKLLVLLAAAMPRRLYYRIVK